MLVASDRVEASFDADLGADGNVYLNGGVRNKGSKRIKDVVVTLRPVHKGMTKPPPVHIGPIAPGTEKKISRLVIPKTVRQYVEHLWSISDLTFD